MDDGDLLRRLGEAAREQARIEDEIEKKVQELAALSKRHRVVSEETIPSIMDEAGFSESPRLTDGTKIAIGDNLRVSTAAKGKYFSAIIAWLRRSGNEALIKNQISVRLGTGEDEVAGRTTQALRSLGLEPEQSQSVNNQSFSALVREMMADGEDVPLEDIGAFVQRQAVLERSDGTTTTKKLAALKKLQSKGDK